MQEMKFRAHDTFFIRKGWISKGMRYVDLSKGEVFINKKEQIRTWMVCYLPRLYTRIHRFYVKHFRKVIYE